MNLNIFRRINVIDDYVLFVIKKYMKTKYLDILMPIVTKMANLGTVWIMIEISLYNFANRIYEKNCFFL